MGKMLHDFFSNSFYTTRVHDRLQYLLHIKLMQCSQINSNRFTNNGTNENDNGNTIPHCGLALALSLASSTHTRTDLTSSIMLTNDKFTKHHRQTSTYLNSFITQRMWFNKQTNKLQQTHVTLTHKHTLRVALTTLRGAVRPIGYEQTPGTESPEAHSGSAGKKCTASWELKPILSHLNLTDILTHQYVC